MVARSEGGTPYEMAHDRRRYDLAAILRAADIANSRDPEKLGPLMELLMDEDSGLRFWGAVGCIALGREAAGAREALLARLQDHSPDVRIAAAESLCLLGNTEEALHTLGELLDDENEYVRLHAANALDNIGETARPLLDLLKGKLDDGSQDVRKVMRKAVADLEPAT